MGTAAPAGAARPDGQPRGVRRPLHGPRPGRAAGVAYGFGVFVDHRLAGEVNLNNVLRGAMQSGTVGYWIDQARAGQGLIAEGVVVLAGFAFEQLDLHRLEICIVPRNPNSRRVMEKLGVREEGIAQRFLEINGVWEDHVRYGFTAEEWADAADLTQPGSDAPMLDACVAVVDAWPTVGQPSPARRIASALAWRLARAPLPHLHLPVPLGRVRLVTLLLGDLGVVVVRRLPCRPRLVHVRGIEAGADLVGHVLQLDVDPVPLAVGLGPQLLLGGNGTSAVRWRWLIRYLLVRCESAVSGGVSSSPWRPSPTRSGSATSARLASEIFACSAAMRSANHGCRVLHTCGFSSRSTAAGWSSMSAMSWIVAFVTHHQLARRRRRPRRHLLGGVEQRVVVDAAVHEPDPLGLGAVEHLAEHAPPPSPPAARRCAGTSTCARRPGGARSAGTGCRTWPAGRRGARRTRAPGSSRRRRRRR